MASALLAGVPDTAPEPTPTDAFKFYLVEKAKTIPEQRKKHLQRLARAERNLIAATGADKVVSKLTREDARKWRDMRVSAGASPSTVKREKNDISAVIATAISELDAVSTNPFKGLALPKATVSRQREREALPPDAIQRVYRLLAAKRQDLLLIWTLLDFTGARPSEISQLQMMGEVVLDHPVPHLIIAERDERTLKTSWSTREVPLAGPAPNAAEQAVRGVSDPSAPAFPRYYGQGGKSSMQKR